MALLEILHFPDPRLRTVAAEVAVFDAELEQFVQDMYATMYDAPGIGLAATQVNRHERIIVIDVSEEKDSPLCLINPELLEQEGSEKMQEGCLSVPEQFEDVTRAERIKVRFQDQFGEQHELETDGLLAVCIQHEMDHLQGKLFVDYLSALKRNRIRKKLIKAKAADSAA